MQRQTSTNQRDASGQDTGSSQGHLSSYLLVGAPGERHQGICMAGREGCDTHGVVLDKRQTQTLRRTGPETHWATLGNPGQTANATMTTNQHVREKAGKNRTA
jgi:hypothetical protein